MATLEKHVKRAQKPGTPLAKAMKDTQSEGMKAQMDYSANARKKQDNNPTKSGSNGKLCAK